jgi:hypothetical protein
MLAVYEYAVQNGGASILFTPLTGNLSADLKYYRWTVYDKFGNSAGGVLDLALPTTAVSVDTSGLSSNGDWKIKFSACKEEGSEESSVNYDVVISDIGGNPAGNSTPENYANVSMLLKLTSTDDAEFTLFPVDGLEIQNGDFVCLEDYTTDPQLDAAGSYIFSLEAKKCWYSPTAEQPAATGITVIASQTPEAGYPIALPTIPVQILSGITIETGSTGAFSDVVTTALNSEDVQPSFAFTLKTDVA